jgi:hypothetical protein
VIYDSFKLQILKNTYSIRREREKRKERKRRHTKTSMMISLVALEKY